MISVIIPTRNAHTKIGRSLSTLVPAAVEGFVREVIIVDAGSDNDEMEKVADAAGAKFLSSKVGRGAQLAKGAEHAKGPWLLFLHADTQLSDNWMRAADRFISDAQTKAGHGVPEVAAAFRFAVDDKGLKPNLFAFMTRLRGKLFGLPYGDQGLLIHKRFYDQLGGFNELPLMEDVDLVRRIGLRRIHILPSDAFTDAEKYRRDGYFMRSFRNLWLLTRYLFGAKPERLAKLYYR